MEEGVRAWAQGVGQAGRERHHTKGSPAWRVAVRKLGCGRGRGRVRGSPLAPRRPSLTHLLPSSGLVASPCRVLQGGYLKGCRWGVCLASVCITHHAHTFTRQSHARPCTPALGVVGPATLPYLRVGGGRCVCVPSTCGTVSPPSLRFSTLAFYATLT